jgi:hypothetical protein
VTEQFRGVLSSPPISKVNVAELFCGSGVPGVHRVELTVGLSFVPSTLAEAEDDPPRPSETVTVAVKVSSALTTQLAPLPVPDAHPLQEKERESPSGSDAFAVSRAEQGVCGPGGWHEAGPETDTVGG